MKQLKTNWKILFVDDSETEIKYLKLLFQLTDIPLTPTFINEAQKGIDKLGQLEKSEFPDIIMVDINMPLMNGFEFAETYFDNFSQKYPDTRLFIYSTSIHSADISRAETTRGATGFIAKPFAENTFTDFIYPYLPNTNIIKSEAAQQ